MGSTAVVIGGGVIGLTTARALMLAGHSVTVLEAGLLGRAASWAGGGILSPLVPWQVPDVVWALAARSIALYPTLCEALHTTTGIDPQWLPSGMEVFDSEQRSEAEAWARRTGMAVHWRGVTGSLWLPWVAQVRNPSLCKALAADLRQRGATLTEHMPVLALSQCGEAVAVQTASGVIQADIAVLTAGAWSASLAASAGWQLPVGPVKGQMIALQASPGLVPHILRQGGRYLIPRCDGVVLVGSTVEEVGFDATLSPTVAASLHDFATSLVADLAYAPRIAHWCGFRPGSAAGVPLIARHPSWKRLYVNTGHHRNGLTLAPASAEHLLKLIAIA